MGDVLRTKHIAQARLVLQHIMDLPIKILNQPISPYIKRGDMRGHENLKWGVNTRRGGMLVGIVQNVASLTVATSNHIDETMIPRGIGIRDQRSGMGDQKDQRSERSKIADDEQYA